MTQLLAHLVGDWLLWSPWLARKKVEWLSAAFIHAGIYAACFAVFFWRQPVALVVIFVTHAFQDHFYWRWYRRSCEIDGDADVPMPSWMAVVKDNTLHLLVNYLALRFLP